jgi:hypothetical protein
MLQATSRFEHGIWEAGGGIAVEYSLEVLEELRRLAVDGFNAFSHGGKEIGGILYGIPSVGCVSVLSFTELTCEYALGPRFLLSDRDREVLADLLQPRDGFHAVGWFRAHTRGGLELDANDGELFDRYFTQPMNLALILKPTRWGPATGAFFVRGPSGEILPRSAREIAIEPLTSEAATPIPAECEPSANGGQPLEGGQSIESTQVSEGRMAAYERDPAAFPIFARPTPALRRFWIWAFCVLALLAMVAALTYRSLPSREIKLQVYAVAPGQVRIEWNHGRRPVLGGASGTLEIEDGGQITKLALDAVQIRSGDAVYVQRTSHITVRLKLNGLKPGSAVMESAIQFVGMTAPLAAPVEIPPNPLPPVEAKVSPEPLVQVQVPRKQFRVPPRTLPVRRTSSSLGATTASTLIVTTLPGPPAVEPAAIRPTGLPEFLSLPPLHAGGSLPPPPVKEPVYAGSRSGRLIWTGVLGRRGVIDLDEGHVSVGSVIGALPGVPVSLRVLPAEFSRDGLVAYTGDRARAEVREAPAKSNGWNAMHFKFDDGRARQLVVLEAPNRSNEFKRLVLRNEGRDCSVVVVDWSVE